MKNTLTVSIDTEVMKVVYTLMDENQINRSTALNFLALQGIMRLEELREKAKKKNTEKER